MWLALVDKVANGVTQSWWDISLWADKRGRFPYDIIPWFGPQMMESCLRPQGRRSLSTEKGKAVPTSRANQLEHRADVGGVKDAETQAGSQPASPSPCERRKEV